MCGTILGIFIGIKFLGAKETNFLLYGPSLSIMKDDERKPIERFFGSILPLCKIIKDPRSCIWWPI